ncbi:MAG: galactose ABC transporter substrate-binding protein [bacterium]|nr:galactose ABC transporter substrate-binding protein [bacterium]
MKKLSSILLVLSLFLTGCSTSLPLTDAGEAPKKSIKIGVSIYDEYDTFIADTVAYLKEWSVEKEKETGTVITLDIVSAGGSQLTQNDQIERFADRGYDAVCVNLVDRTDATVIIDKARNADMPIVFFNRELVEEDLERWDKLYYVGAIAQQSGEMQGQIVVDACDERFSEIDINRDGILQYVMLEGEAGHQDALVRTQSSVSTVTEAGYEVEKLGDEIANWNRAQAKTKMNMLLERYANQIEVVFANDDDMALGALEALEESHVTHIPMIVGVNGIPEVLDAIKAKHIEGTVYNDGRGQAQAILEMSYALAMGEPFPDQITLTGEKYVYLPYKIITYNNVQQYISNQ